MTTLTCSDPKSTFSQHLEALRDYAKRAVLQQGSLTLAETMDRVRRMDEWFTMGQSFGLTEKELVGLLFKDVSRTRRVCGCPHCRSREN